MARPSCDSDSLSQHVDKLANELRNTQRELERLRLERRVSPTFLPLLVMVLGAALATRSLDAQTSGRVVAPFTVVDKAGNPLFEVVNDNGRATIRAGLVIMGTGASGGGYVVVQRPNKNTALALGQRNDNFALRVFDISGNTDLATVGEASAGSGGYVAVRRQNGNNAVALGQSNGSFGLRVFDTAGKSELATVSEAKVGGGVFVANDGAGKTRMLMSGTGQLHAVDEGGTTRATMTSEGAFSIRNAAGTTVLRLGESAGGAGQLQLANSAGNAMVEAGVLRTNAGVVQAYPLGLGAAPAGGLLGIGAPGTFIMGFIGSRK